MPRSLIRSLRARPARSATAVAALVLTTLFAVALAAPGRPEATVVRVEDFELGGEVLADAWSRADWITLHKRGGGLPYDARFKTLWSETGTYFLLQGSDRRVTATFEEDFADLWTEDVFEVFLWPDERWPVYFEYEISPLNRELPILVPNFDGRFLGWRPWKYRGERRTRTAVRGLGGGLESGAPVEGWRAEVFIPWELLRPLRSVPPRPGTRWRANVYRVDHDGDDRTAWDWARVGKSFHEFRSFGTLVFQAAGGDEGR